MNTLEDKQTVTDYYRVEKAIRLIYENYHDRPTLQDISAELNLSEFHFQRLFKRWAGVTPNQFLQFVTLGKAKALLQESKSLLDTSFQLGYSSPSRLHDLFIKFDSITPGEYKSQGKDLRVEYGFALTPFGECLLARTHRGICHLSFVTGANHDELLAVLRNEFFLSNLQENQARAYELASQVFSSSADKTIEIFMKGSPFQVQVWRALLQVPAGAVVSYGDLAGFIGKPNASRVVGSAVARNKIGYLVPCHRVIRQLGTFGNYRWGKERKTAMLLYENSKIHRM